MPGRRKLHIFAVVDSSTHSEKDDNDWVHGYAYHDRGQNRRELLHMGGTRHTMRIVCARTYGAVHMQFTCKT